MPPLIREPYRTRVWIAGFLGLRASKIMPLRWSDFDFDDRTLVESYPPPEGWLFANPETGRPYHQETIQQKHIRKAGRDAGLGDGVGWHTFRHSYRSWMDDTGAPMTVQKELMRHASIQTTMNVYGKAMRDSKRQAHSKVVEMVLKSKKSNEATASERQVAANGS